jgi:hypothetical protein
VSNVEMWIVCHWPRSVVNARWNWPPTLVGLPTRRMCAPSAVRNPSAASKICSSTPEASSTTSRMNVGVVALEALRLVRGQADREPLLAELELRRRRLRELGVAAQPARGDGARISRHSSCSTCAHVGAVVITRLLRCA